MRSEKDILASVPTQLFIGGEWVDAEGGKTLTVSDPATGEHLATIANASEADAQKAIDAAAAVQELWGNTAPRVRGEILRKAWELLIERRDDFALLMTMEMGKPFAEAQGEVTYGGEFLRWFSEEAVRINGRYGSNPEGTGTMIVSKRPVGPSFLITPWNFPLAMATRKIAPAIAAGCTAIIKPAELTPLTTLAFAALPQGRCQRDHDQPFARRLARHHSGLTTAENLVHGLDSGQKGVAHPGVQQCPSHIDGAWWKRAVHRVR